MQKYSVNQHLTEIILSWVKSGEIAIPEIQRPFVWEATRVRDLLDSLYQGYPIGYLIYHFPFLLISNIQALLLLERRSRGVKSAGANC